MTLLRSRVAAVVAAALVLLGLGYGAGLAVGAPKPTKVSVCVTKKNVAVGASAKGRCPKGTHRIAIATAGSQGARGDRGPAGPAGPPGPAGTTAFGDDTDHQQQRTQSDDCFIGEVTLSAGDFANGVPARGQVLPIAQNTPLFSIIGTKYGGNGTTTFALPDLRAAAPDGMTYSICVEGIFPAIP